MTTKLLSKERLTKMHAETMEVIDSKPRATDTASIEVNAKLFATMCGALLAGLEQEPVFFVEIEGGDWINAGRIEGKDRPDLGLLPDGINNLYTHPAPSIPAAVPEGMTYDAARNFVLINGMANEDRATLAMRVWNCCRAAMRHHSGDVTDKAEPVIHDDTRRMDWLVSKTVNVREPMVYGSHDLFWSQTISDDWEEEHKTTLREQIDAAIEAEPKWCD